MLIIQGLLMLVAVFCFFQAAFGKDFKVNMQAVGLMFLSMAMLVPLLMGFK